MKNPALPEKPTILAPTVAKSEDEKRVIQDIEERKERLIKDIKDIHTECEFPQFLDFIVRNRVQLAFREFIGPTYTKDQWKVVEILTVFNSANNGLDPAQQTEENKRIVDTANRIREGTEIQTYSVKESLLRHRRGELKIVEGNINHGRTTPGSTLPPFPQEQADKFCKFSAAITAQAISAMIREMTQVLNQYEDYCLTAGKVIGGKEAVANYRLALSRQAAPAALPFSGEAASLGQAAPVAVGGRPQPSPTGVTAQGKAKSAGVEKV